MPRRCRACSSPNRTAIEKAIVSGEPLREISEKSRISISALHRHKHHAGQALVKARERREEKSGDGLLDEIERIRKRAWELLSSLEKSGDLRGGVVALREVRESLETQAKLLALAAQMDVAPTEASGETTEYDLSRLTEEELLTLRRILRKATPNELQVNQNLLPSSPEVRE
jgi:hypothetical protein